MQTELRTDKTFQGDTKEEYVQKWMLTIDMKAREWNNQTNSKMICHEIMRLWGLLLLTAGKKAQNIMIKGGLQNINLTVPLTLV